MPTSPSASTNGPSLVYRYTIGSQSTEVLGVVILSSDGTEVSSSGGLFVQGTTASGGADTALPVKIAGSDGTNARSIKVDTSGNQVAVGNVANGVADAGAPIKIGGYANATFPTTASNAQRVNGWFGLNGQIIIGCPSFTGADGQANTALYQMTGAGGSQGQFTTAPFVFNGTTYDRQRGDVNATVTRSALGSASLAYAGVTGGITTAASTAMFAAAGAGTRNFLHGIQWKNTSVVASEIVVLDGATVIWRGHASASMVMTDGYTFDPPLRGTANTAMNVQMVTTGTATIVSAQGSTGA